MIVLAIASAILVVTVSLQDVIDATIQLSILPRCLIVVGLTFPVAFLLGFCFPIGIRLVGRFSGEALPWMWGINGACGVLSSILAVGFSMWEGIHGSLYLAAACYAALVIPVRRLSRREDESAVMPLETTQPIGVGTGPENISDPSGSRTRVPDVRGRCPNH